MSSKCYGRSFIRSRKRVEKLPCLTFRLESLEFIMLSPKFVFSKKKNIVFFKKIFIF